MKNYDNQLLDTLVFEEGLRELRELRAERRTRPLVVDASAAARLGVAPFLEGTIVVLVGEPGNREMLDDVLEAVNKADAKTMRILGENLVARQHRALQPRRGGASPLPNIVDVRYGSAPVATGIIPMPGIGVAGSVAFWNGGDLNEKDFVVEQFLPGKDSEEVPVVILMLPPSLTELERALVDAVPPDMSGVNVLAPTRAWPAAVATALATAALGWAVGKAADWVYERFFDGGQGADQGPGGDQYNQFVEGDQYQQQQVGDQQQQQVGDQQQQQVGDQQQQQVGDQQQQQAGQQGQQAGQQGQQAAQQQQQQQQQQAGQQGQQQQQQQQQGAEQQQQQQQQQQGANTLLKETVGLDIYGFDQKQYLSILNRFDFESLDATQSAKALLRIREEMVMRGMR